MKKNILIVLLVGVLLMAVGCSSAVDDTEVTEEIGAENEALTFEGDYLVNQEWLKANINHEDLIILDARGEKAYNDGHIPNAIATAWQSFSKMNGAPGEKNWGTVKEADELSLTIAALGIDESKKVVVYSDVLNGWGEDGRIFWTLHMAGLENVRILDGGYNLWESSDQEISKAINPVESSSFKVSTLDKTTSIDMTSLIEDYDNYVVVDTRALDEYEGATKFGEARGGHLPDAIHFNFKEVLNADGTFKAIQDIEKAFEAAGLKKEDEIVTYCTAGIRSAHLQIALEMAGYEKARNYDASFYEWSGNNEVSVEK